MIKKKLFTPYKLEDERGESIVIPVRLNLLEQKLLKAIKESLNIHSDSKALKISARVGFNVLQNTFGADILKYLCKGDRERLSDYKAFISVK